MKLFIKQNGVESGPYTMEQVVGMIHEGRLLPSDWLRGQKKAWFWVPQDKNWIQAGLFVELIPGRLPELTPVARRLRIASLVSTAALVFILAVSYILRKYA